MALRGVHGGGLPGYLASSSPMAYSKTFKPVRRDQGGVPWRTVVLLLVGVSVLVWTLRGSSASEGARAAREAAFEKLYPGSRRPQNTKQLGEQEQAAQKWSERKVSQVYEEEELQTESDRANTRAPAVPFDPKIFKQYVDLPPLPSTSEDEYMVSRWLLVVGLCLGAHTVVGRQGWGPAGWHAGLPAPTPVTADGLCLHLLRGWVALLLVRSSALLSLRVCMPFADPFKNNRRRRHRDCQGGWELTEEIYNQAASHPAATVLSFGRPRAVHFRSFLSPDEVQHLIDLSKEHLVRSEVLHNAGDGSVSDVRTSFGYWPPQTSVTRNITNRIHRLVGIPDHFGEDLYVLNYKRGQQYEACVAGGPRGGRREGLWWWWWWWLCCCAPVLWRCQGGEKTMPADPSAHARHLLRGPPGSCRHNDQCMSHSDGVADPACLQFLKRGRGPKCGPGHGGPSCGDRMATFILSLKCGDAPGNGDI